MSKRLDWSKVKWRQRGVRVYGPNGRERDRRRAHRGVSHEQLHEMRELYIRLWLTKRDVAPAYRATMVAARRMSRLDAGRVLCEMRVEVRRA